MPADLNDPGAGLIRTDDPGPALSDFQEQFSRVLALDFEALPDGSCFHIGAVLGDRSFCREKITDLGAALQDLTVFARPADYLLGHNILYHDLPLVARVDDRLGLLDLSVIDTLFLSPLAFPENPYHGLVKDYKLVRSSKNDPVADARLALAIFQDQTTAFYALNQACPELIRFYAFAFSEFCLAPQFNLRGIHDLFESLSRTTVDRSEALSLFKELTFEKVCPKGLEDIWTLQGDKVSQTPVFAYLLSWLRVSGKNSIIPPWVRHRFPEISTLLKQLRYGCGHEACDFCRSHNDSLSLLNQYFGFENFRTDVTGTSLQKQIVEAGIQGKSLLGILPTGGGKSLCYQIPALHRYERLGELTLVISPLKALMKDQVDNLNQALGMEAAAAINGSLTLPERGAVMEKVRLGDIGILYISPEQLRNFSIARLIDSREVGFWVFDEAHCLSKWGHDFRPDYLFVTQFIRRTMDRTDSVTPLVGAFTATAKQDVVQEILSHFSETLALDIKEFHGGVERENLAYQVWPVSKNEKEDLIFTTLKEGLSKDFGGAIVYCGKRKTTESLSRFLNEKGLVSEPFHAGRSEPDKRNIQDAFIRGDISIICATNAFGMGIDKKDIRLVIHADIPGSLENYLQEAGRAGRDQKPSDCILLYEQEDIQNQFALNTYSQVSIKDIQKILKKLKEKGAKTPEIVITPAEIMGLIGYGDSRMDDTRARTGISWLERKGFVERAHNQTVFFNGVPGVKTMEEARQKMERLNLSQMTRAIYTTVLDHLFNADPNALVSADEISISLGRIENLPETYADSRHIMGLLADMAAAGLVKEGISLTAFVRPRGRENGPKQLDFFSRAESQMLEIMGTLAPEAGTSPDIPNIFNLRLMSQQLKDRGFEPITPDRVEAMLRAMAGDMGTNSGKSLKLSGRAGTDQRRVHVKFSWQTIGKRMALRHQAARVVLETIISRLPEALRTGQAEVLSQFFFTDLANALASDLFLSGFQGDSKSLIEKALLFLHDMRIIVLQNGLGVFRQAYTLTVLPEAGNRRYSEGDYEPLSHHYAQKNVQVHVMEKYARLGIEKIKSAVNFVTAYFSSSHESFIQQYFPGQEEIIKTAMTAEAFKQIIQSLDNSRQEAVIAADPDTNILILAGPGSGKTRTLVHRTAWLIKAKSIHPETILVLCFNHHAMVSLKKRIKTLVGQSSYGVTVMTFHGFAMRLIGRSFLEGNISGDVFDKTQGFDDMIQEAVDILNGHKEAAGISPSEAREHLLARYRYVLVDEYQDIDEIQYKFISALTGRLEQDTESKIAIMAVGDDDQSIYGFRHANVAFIRQFKRDYGAKTHFLLENYRSAYPIIQVANAFIAQNQNRMKQDRPILINHKRKPRKKVLERLEPRELVQLVIVPDIPSQAVSVAQKIKEILAQNPQARLEDMAVVSRHGISHPFLVSLRMALAREKIDFCYSIKGGQGRAGLGFPMSRLREFQTLLSYLELHQKESRQPIDLKKEVMNLFPAKNTWTDQVAQILDSWCRINPDREISLARARDFALETLLEERKEHKTGSGVFLGTVHSVKGMEFSHVFILDGGWNTPGDTIDLEEERRLYYVGMTRARETLHLFSLENQANPHVEFLKTHGFVRESMGKASTLPGYSQDLTVSILGLESFYINYPGLFPADHPVHGRLKALGAGDRVLFKAMGDHIFLVNEPGDRLARLSLSASARWTAALDHIVTARVLGMVHRKKEDDPDQAFGNPQCHEWELPIVEILHKKL